MRLSSQTNVTLSAFLLGAVLSGVFFSSQLSDPEKIVLERSQELLGAVLLADINQNSIVNLVRKPSRSSDPIRFFLATGTTSSDVLPQDEAVTASSSSEASAEFDGGELQEDISVQETAVEIIEALQETVPTEVVFNSASEDVVLSESQVDVVQEPEERELPEGVFKLANGDYIDKNGDKITGDPYSYNYQPPQEEEKFVTPGGVVMDRFGVIHFTPESVDESKVLIPPTVIDPEKPPSTISPIYIPRYVLTAIHANPFLTCAQLQLFGNDGALCELYKEHKDDYEWIRVDEIEE